MKVNLPFNWGQLWMFRRKGQTFHANNFFHTNLTVNQYRDGQLIEKRNLGGGVVTQAGANFLAADWTNATATLKLTNYHDSGTGSFPPSVNDTSLQTPTGGVRVAGGQSNVFNMYQSVGNTSYTSTLSITEWAIWTALTGGTMFDRRTFTAIPVINGDVLQWIWQLTVQAGG